MVISVVVVLFIIQLISIYLIVLLNGKISNFKDLERRQDQLLREMDDTIGVYLLEMREENDRLIQELQRTKVAPQQISSVEESGPFVKMGQPVQQVPVSDLERQQQVVESAPIESRMIVPKTWAANAYNRQKIQPAVIEESKENIELPVERTIEQQIVDDYQSGMSVEKIAKKMQKGKTEIELLIKFHA